MMQSLFLGFIGAVVFPAFSGLGLVNRPSGDVFLDDKGGQEFLPCQMWRRFIAVSSDRWVVHSLSPKVITATLL
jgi:hypothetical protein